MRRFSAGGLAILALTAVAVVLVAWPVIAGFSTRDVSQNATTTSTTAPWCRALLTNMDNVRRLPLPEIRRVIVVCDMTYTKSCGGAADIDPHTGVTRHSSYTCEIRDKHGKIVRTYTTDALRPTP